MKKTRIALLGIAASALALPAAALSANVGTAIVDWTGSGFTVSPTTFSAVAGDTITLQYTNRDGTQVPVLVDGTGAFKVTSDGRLCSTIPTVGGSISSAYCAISSGGPTDTQELEVITPGTLKVWRNTLGIGFVGVEGEIAVGTAAPSPAPTPTAPAAPATTTAAAPAPPPPTAQLLRSPTTQNTRQSNRIGCSQVSVPLQLSKVGKYTFIYERSTGQSASARESQVTSTTRVTWNTGSTLGKRKLSKASTAPVLVTTEANKRLVVNGLIKKAKADNLRLRVIHTAADGTLTQDVFDA